MSATPYSATAAEAASNQDRAYFARHPQAGELPGVRAGEPVTVYQIDPRGFRIRVPRRGRQEPPPIVAWARAQVKEGSAPR